MKQRTDHKAVKEVRIALRRAPFVLAAVAASCAIAACGSSSSSSTSSGSSGGTTTTASATSGSGFGERRAKLVACLKQHGVTVPQFRRPPAAGTGTTGNGAAPGTGAPPGGFRPGGGRGFFGGHPPSAKMQAAFKACRADLGVRAGRFRTLARANIQKFVTCVRQHGYNLPAPNFSGNGPTFPANIRTNKQFQAASRSCASLLTRPGAGAGAGSAGTSSGSGSSTTAQS